MATSTTAMVAVTATGTGLVGFPVTAAPTATPSFDPYTQNITFTMNDGVTTFTVPLDVIDWLYVSGFQQTECYGFLIGAATMMLLIVLTMTPRESFSRVSTRINIVMLLLVIAHSVAGASFFTGAFVELYCQFSNDLSRVHLSDYIGQSLVCIFSLALLPLVLVALIIQAWSMIRLWPITAKWIIFVVSFFLILTTIGLHATQEMVLLLDVDNAISIEKVRDLVWVQLATAITVAVCIPWFCLLFLSRLIIHMWRHRSFLPNAKGMTSVEVLAVTNGIFLVIPGKSYTLPYMP
jgi:pheromone alpha factor receptor